MYRYVFEWSVCARAMKYSTLVGAHAVIPNAPCFFKIIIIII